MKTNLKTLIACLLISSPALAAQTHIQSPAEWRNILPALDTEKSQFIELPNYIEKPEDVDVREALPTDPNFWKINTAQGSNRP